MEISTNILRGFAAVLREKGIPTRELLREAGVDERTLERAVPATPLDEAVRIITTSYRLSKDPALALRVGSRAPIQSLGMLGELAVHCPTVRACLTEAEAYLPLALPMCRFRLVEEGKDAHFIFEPPFADPLTLRFTTELSLAFAARIGRHFASFGEAPSEVAVRHGRPRYADAYSETFGCPIRFDAPRNEIVFPAALLDVPQPFLDDSLFRLLKRRADDLMLQERTRDLLHERVRHVLRHEVDLSSVNPGSIARRLGVSPRSLRRRLGDEGHSLSALTDEVRRELSLSELLNPDVPIKRIADRVGFSEVSAFHRAFKRWTGVTPARYRAQTSLGHSTSSDALAHAS
jgi:AraC-like DNA-binding protein